MATYSCRWCGGAINVVCSRCGCEGCHAVTSAVNGYGDPVAWDDVCDRCGAFFNNPRYCSNSCSSKSSNADAIEKRRKSFIGDMSPLKVLIIGYGLFWLGMQKRGAAFFLATVAITIALILLTDSFSYIFGATAIIWILYMVDFKRQIDNYNEALRHKYSTD